MAQSSVTREDRITGAVRAALVSKQPDRLAQAAQLLTKMADLERAEAELLARLPAVEPEPEEPEPEEPEEPTPDPTPEQLPA